MQHGFDGVKYIVLRDKAHFKIELIEFARAAVGAGIFVAETWCDLEIAIEARDHQQLLEHLRRLRQRIEFARMHAARYQIIARALGAARCQDRGLEFGKALVDHPTAHA